MLVGSQPPSINSDTPSDTPLNVILELEADESTFGPMPVTGYYLAVGARPEDIQRQLQVLGKQSPR